MVGGFLVAAAAVGTYGSYLAATAGPTESYVVARHGLAPGQRLTAADLELVAMDLPAPLSSDRAFSDPARLVGATLIAPVGRGELVQASAVVRKRSGPDERELSFALETSRAVAGTLQPGELVDVLATFGIAGDVRTEVVVRGARVIALDRGSASLADSRTLTITVAVGTAEDATALAHAVDAAKVTLVRSADGSSEEGQTREG